MRQRESGYTGALVDELTRTIAGLTRLNTSAGLSSTGEGGSNTAAVDVPIVGAGVPGVSAGMIPVTAVPGAALAADIGDGVPGSMAVGAAAAAEGAEPFDATSVTPIAPAAALGSATVPAGTGAVAAAPIGAAVAAGGSIAGATVVVVATPSGDIFDATSAGLSFFVSCWTRKMPPPPSISIPAAAPAIMPHGNEASC